MKYYYNSCYTDPIIGIQPVSNEIPKEFKLYQNYPNPFNAVTKIKFSLPVPSKGWESEVRLIVYDVLGQEVATLFSSPLGRSGGATYEVEWDAANFPSGVYFYKLTAAEFTQARRMVLIK